MPIMVCNTLETLLLLSEELSFVSPFLLLAGAAKRRQIRRMRIAMEALPTPPIKVGQLVLLVFIGRGGIPSSSLLVSLSWIMQGVNSPIVVLNFAVHLTHQPALPPERS